MAEEIVFSELLKQAEREGYTFSALPASEYDTRIMSAEVRQTASQKNKIVVRFQVTSGPYAGRSVFNDFVLTPANPNAMVIFFRQMANLGLDGSYFAANPSLARVAEDLKGREQRLRLGIRSWQGVDRNNILQIMQTQAAAAQAPMFSQGSFAPPAPTLPPIPDVSPPQVQHVTPPAPPQLHAEPVVAEVTTPRVEVIEVVEEDIDTILAANAGTRVEVTSPESDHLTHQEEKPATHVSAPSLPF